MERHEEPVRPGKRLMDEFSAIRKRRGWVVQGHLEQLGFVLKLHLTNYAELKAYVRELVATDDEATVAILEMWDQKNRHLLYRRLDEVSRRLLNFLASAMMLADHTRAHIRRLYSQRSRFRGEYESHVQADLASSSPVCQFVKQLRNYNLHHRFPVMMSNLNWEGEGTSLRSRTVIDLPALRASGEFTGLARQYLEEQGDELSVEQFADDYTAVISAFYDWLQLREMAVNRKALATLERRMAELRKEHQRWAS